MILQFFPSLNVTMVNQLWRVNNVTITLQWPREPGAVYHISVMPKTLFTTSIIINYDTISINTTISYNIQYDVSIVSSLCDITTTKILKYSKYNYYGYMYNNIIFCQN